MLLRFGGAGFGWGGWGKAKLSWGRWGEAPRGFGTGSSTHHHILNPNVRATPVSAGKIASRNLSRPIAGTGAFPSLPETLVAPTGCSSNHLGTTAPPVAQDWAKINPSA